MRKIITTLGVSGVLIASLTGCASTPERSAHGRPGASEVPTQLRPAAGEVLFLTLRGEGAQIYDCASQAGSSTNYAWTFRAPDAQLKDSAGHIVGRHFTGPTWELDEGGSVIGETKARAPSPSATAIPWLLLTTRATAGHGKLTATTSIQRLQTVGGVAPAVGCNAANAGKVARVPYSANYYFYRAAQ